MGQSRNKTKESNKEKKQRRKEFAATKRQLYTIVVPTLVVAFLFIVFYVYAKTRTIQYID